MGSVQSQEALWLLTLWGKEDWILPSIPHPSTICAPPHLIASFHVTCLLLSPNLTNTIFYFWWSLLFCSITYDPYSYKYKNIKSVINIWDKTFNICAFAYVCVHAHVCVVCVHVCVHVYRCICVCASTDAYANVWVCLWFKVDWLHFLSLITLHFVLWAVSSDTRSHWIWPVLLITHVGISISASWVLGLRVAAVAACLSCGS